MNTKGQNPTKYITNLFTSNPSFLYPLMDQACHYILYKILEYLIKHETIKYCTVSPETSTSIHFIHRTKFDQIHRALWVWENYRGAKCRTNKAQNRKSNLYYNLILGPNY